MKIKGSTYFREQYPGPRSFCQYAILCKQFSSLEKKSKYTSRTAVRDILNVPFATLFLTLRKNLQEKPMESGYDNSCGKSLCKVQSSMSRQFRLPSCSALLKQSPNKGRVLQIRYGVYSRAALNGIFSSTYGVLSNKNDIAVYWFGSTVKPQLMIMSLIRSYSFYSKVRNREAFCDFGNPDDMATS